MSFLRKCVLRELFSTICHGCPRTSRIDTNGSHIHCDWRNKRVTCEMKTNIIKNHLGAQRWGKRCLCLRRHPKRPLRYLPLQEPCCQNANMHNLNAITTQYGIKHFRMYSGRSAKCYVNPLNDLFRPPTITTQR